MLLSVIKSTNYVSGLCIAVVCNHFAIENSIRNRTCVGKVDKCKFASNFCSKRILSVNIRLHSHIILIPTKTPPIRDARKIGRQIPFFVKGHIISNLQATKCVAVNQLHIEIVNSVGGAAVAQGNISICDCNAVLALFDTKLR